MTRSALTAAVVLSLFGLVANASAGQKGHLQHQGSQGKSQNDLGWNLSSGRGLSGMVSNFKKSGHHKHDEKSDPPKHDDSPKPIDPGRGDGRQPLPPSPPQAVPGFVWVDGHWERARAPKTPTVVADPSQSSGGVVVRDHRTPAPQPIVRDHRTPAAQPIVRDHRTPVPQPIVRDHRVSNGVIIRDHRTDEPLTVVRDHR